MLATVALNKPRTGILPGLLCFIAPIVTLGVIVAIAVVALNAPQNTFRSPDENAGQLFTKTLAETGRLEYSEDYLANDDENLLHSRGALTYDGRAVPFGFLGLPVVYAPFYKLLGGGVRYIAIGLSVLATVALASAGARLVPERPWLAWLAVLSVSPLIYFFNRPFLNALPATAFECFAAYFVVRYFQSGSGARRELVWASVAFALAAFMRYELAIFQTLLVTVMVLHKRGTAWQSVMGDLSAYVAPTLLLFVVPVFALNQYVYGSPFTYGYGLFNEAYFPNRVATGDFPGNVPEQMRSVLMPSYPFDLGLAGSSLVHQAIGIAPSFVAVCCLGLAHLVWRGRVHWRAYLAYGLLAIYIYLYRGAGISWLAEEDSPHLEASVIRYALPLYVAGYFLLVHLLGRVRWSCAAAGVVTLLAVASVASIVSETPGNLLHIRDQLRASHELANEVILPSTEPDAVIYTDVYDKILGRQRIVAAWWGGSLATQTGFFRPDEVARSMSRLRASRPVYLLVHEEEDVLPRLNSALAAYGLKASPTSVGRLYSIDVTAEDGRPER